MKQEPGTNAEIQAYANNTWGFTQPMFAKSNVNAACDGTTSDCTADSTKCCPTNSKVFKYLESVLSGKVPWNFEKYLVGKDGVHGARFSTRGLLSRSAIEFQAFAPLEPLPCM
jgi:glutathione peroxidase-family protein